MGERANSSDLTPSEDVSVAPHVRALTELICSSSCVTVPSAAPSVRVVPRSSLLLCAVSASRCPFDSTRRPFSAMSFASTASCAHSTASASQRARPASARHAHSSTLAPTSAASASAAPAFPASTSSSAPSSSLLKRSSSDRKGSTYESQTAQQTRLAKLFGTAALDPGVQYSSTRLAYIPLELLRVTAEEKAALNALQPGKKSYWSTGSGQNHELVFKMSARRLTATLGCDGRGRKPRCLFPVADCLDGLLHRPPPLVLRVFQHLLLSGRLRQDSQQIHFALGYHDIHA